MGSFSLQNAYLGGVVQQTAPRVKRRRYATSQLRNNSNTYRLQVERNNSVIVCKKFCLSVLQISDGRLMRALKTVASGNLPGTDGRGKAASKHKTTPDQLKVICDHISSFPANQSHYTRSHNPNRTYLADTLNIRLMFNLYIEHCAEISNHTPVNEHEHIYRRVLNNYFNIHFHTPSKDTCSKCDA